MTSSFKLTKVHILLLVIIVTALLLRVYAISTPLSSDAVNILKAKKDIATMMGELIREDVYPPLTLLLIHFWSKIDGSVAWIRTYFVLFGVGLCFLIFCMGREYLDHKYGLLAASICALSPLMIWTSRYTRSYVDSGFFMVLSTFFLMKILAEGGKSRIHWGGYIISSLLGLFTSYFNFVVLGVQNLYFLFRIKRTKSFFLRWVFAQTSLLVLYTPWLPYMIHQLRYNVLDKSGSPYWLYHGFKLSNFDVGNFVRNLVALNGLDPYFMKGRAFTEILSLKMLTLIALTVVVVFVLLCWRGLHYLDKNRDKGNAERVGITFFPFMSVIPVFVVFSMSWADFILAIPRYLVFCHALFTLFIVAILRGFYRRYSTVILFIFLAFLYGARYPEIYKPEFQYSKAFRYLQDTVGPNDCLMAMEEINGRIEEEKNFIDLSMLLTRDSETGNYSMPQSGPVQEELRTKLKPFSRIYIYSHGMLEPFRPYKVTREWLEENGYRLTGRKEYRGLYILELIRRKNSAVTSKEIIR